MKANQVTIEIGSDLYVAGRTEDGHEYTAEVYFVVATNARGDRWRHASSFPGCKTESDEEGYTHFADIREQAQRDAQTLVDRIQSRINAGGALNLQHWHEDRPVYGSSAYVAYGQADDLEHEYRERMQGI